MKKLGWILIALGTLAFIGAASKGHSVFGPIFWIGLGGAFVYLKREQDEKQTEAHNMPEQINDEIPEVCDNVLQKEKTEQEMALSSEQKEAALCLIAFFAGFNDDIMSNDTACMVAFQSATFFGVTNYKETLAEAMPKFNDADKLIDAVLTIKDKKAKEFMLLSCYDLAKMSEKEDAYELLYNIANDMGYDRDRLNRLIRQYSQINQL